MPQNVFRDKLVAGAHPTQAFYGAGTGYLARILAGVGFDSLLLDMQHGPLTWERAYELVPLLEPTCSAVLRVPSAERGSLERAADTGAHGIICPDVTTPEEAELLAEARRVGRAADPVAIAQIESPAGLEALSDIAKVPGIDALMPGPSDLSMSLGGEPGLHYTDPVIAGHVRTVIDAAHEHGLWAGVPTLTAEHARLAVEWGADYLIVASDVRWLRLGATAALEELRAATR